MSRMLKPAIICDLDGTLSSCDWRRWRVDSSLHAPDAAVPVFGTAIVHCVACKEVWPCSWAENEHHKDWHGFHSDLSLDSMVPEIEDVLRSGTYAVIFTTGRPENYRYPTEWWLMEHDIEYDLLLMRPKGDFRDDSIVKREMYVRDIEARYTVLFAIDDRPSICDVWRGFGIEVKQVTDPGLEPARVHSV